VLDDRRNFSSESSERRPEWSRISGRECQSRDAPYDAPSCAHMPVLRDGKLAGIISIGDVVKHRLEDLESETNVLRDAYMATR
jgi:CBS domain-containing protein